MRVMNTWTVETINYIVCILSIYLHRLLTAKISPILWISLDLVNFWWLRIDYLMVSNHLVAAKNRLILSRNLYEKYRTCIFSELCMILYLRSSGAGDTVKELNCWRSYIAQSRVLAWPTDGIKEAHFGGPNERLIINTNYYQEVHKPAACLSWKRRCESVRTAEWRQHRGWICYKLLISHVR